MCFCLVWRGKNRVSVFHVEHFCKVKLPCKAIPTSCTCFVVFVFNALPDTLCRQNRGTQRLTSRRTPMTLTTPTMPPNCSVL